MNSTFIYAQLQNVTYSSAIDRYNYLKTRFFLEYSSIANQEEKILIDQIENEIVAEINNNPIENQELIVESLYEDIQKIMISKLEGKKEQRRDIKNLQKISQTKAKEAARQLGEQLLPEEELRQYVLQSLSSMGINSGFSIEDIVNQVRSYRNKIILTKTNTSAKRYVTSTKGYYREALVYKAFYELEKYLDTIPVISAGDIKNKKGQDTLYDTYISFFNNIKENFNALVNESVDISYGIQSKSWTAPWETDNVNYFNQKYGFSVGNRSDMLNASGLKDKASNAWSWTQGVLYLEKNAVEAIGENQLGWVTGNNFYWTSDLISYFRAMNYFLAFGYSENKNLSPSVKWQQQPT